MFEIIGMVTTGAWFLGAVIMGLIVRFREEPDQGIAVWAVVLWPLTAWLFMATFLGEAEVPETPPQVFEDSDIEDFK